MSPVLITIANVKFQINSLTGDGRKEHPPMHVHVIYQNSEYTFEFEQIRKLDTNDFTRKKGVLEQVMIDASQFVLDNFQNVLIDAWNKQIFKDTFRISDLKGYQRMLRRKKKNQTK